MIAFIDDHRGDYGVEPICRVLPIAPAWRPDQALDPGEAGWYLVGGGQTGFYENLRVYGVRKILRQMKREVHHARCTVARLMRSAAPHGVIRGKPMRTMVADDKAAPCPLDHVNRVFRAPPPNMLWLSDFTYVSTWSGFVYVAFAGADPGDASSLSRSPR